MNAGLTNLHTLKSWLLPAAMLDGTDYDVLIAALGNGVAGHLETHCNRRLLRTVDDVFECTADRLHVSLPRSPIEVVTKIETRGSLAEGWVEQAVSDLLENLSRDAGLLYFAAEPGEYPSRLRITYTGGYWADLLEPADDGFPTAQPVGATAVPPNLLLAWRLLCESVWKTHDKLGLSIGEQPGGGGGSLLGLSLPGLDIPPYVLRLLAPYQRISFT